MSGTLARPWLAGVAAETAPTKQSQVAEPRLAEGSGLDVDSIDGAGPEIFPSATPARGPWWFYVNDWGNFDQAGYNFDDAAHHRELITARLSLVYSENTIHERRESFVVPLRNLGELTLVKAIHY